MSIRLSVLLQDHEVLRSGFELAIRSSMAATISRCAHGEPEEPDFVAMLTLHAVPMIADALRQVASRHGITSRVSSVFCHQRPMVQFNRGHDTCELGDILIVHRHTDRHGLLMRNNALLLQAKVCDKSSHEVPASERHQLRLYETWPTFTYVRTNRRLNGQRRNVRPKVRHNGAQYLLIDGSKIATAAGASVLGYMGSHGMSVWPAERVLSTHFGLADELVRFMVGVTGRTFEDRSSDDASGWSEVVWDLLEHSVMHAFNRAKIGVSSTSRLAGDSLYSTLKPAACFFDSDASPLNAARSVADHLLTLQPPWARPSQGKRPPGDNGGEQSDDSSGGVSLIVIETQQDEGMPEGRQRG